jgi:GNAT superfamily N-acetyltransferase
LRFAALAALGLLRDFRFFFAMEGLLLAVRLANAIACSPKRPRQLPLGSINLTPYHDSMSTLAPTFASIHDLGPQASDAIVRQFYTIFRKVMRGPAVTATGEYFRYITNEPHPFGNFAIVSDAASLDHTRTAIEPLLSLKAPIAVIFLGALSEDVENYVRECGFSLGESMPTMAVDIDSLAPTTLPDGYRFEQFTSPNHDTPWCEAFATGYVIPRRVADDFGPHVAADLLKSGEVQYFGIFHGNRIVCTSMLYLDGAIAGVYCVSTRTDHRGKGLGAHATAQPLRQARSQGYKTGILQSSAMGESVYRRLGFQQFGAMPLYVRIPEGMNVAH